MIGDDVLAALPELRAQAESLLTETVEVGQFTDGTDELLNPIETLTDEQYTGPGQIKFPSLAVSERVTASQQAASVSAVLKVPVGSGADIRPGAQVRVTGSTVDGSLVGRKFRIGAWPAAGMVTTHRYPIEELS